MRKSPFFATNLPPVGELHFFRVGDWVYVLTIGKPTGEEVVKMAVHLDSNESFKILPTASKITLILGIQKIRAKLSVFDDHQLMKNRRVRDRQLLEVGLRTVLESVGGRWGDDILRLTPDLVKRAGTQEKAHRAMRKYVDFTRLLIGINESAPITAPQSEPQTRSLKQDAETEMLRDLLAEVDVAVIESGSDAHDSKGLVLMGLMTRWTSGYATLPDAMRKRLAVLRARAGKFSGNLARNIP